MGIQTVEFDPFDASPFVRVIASLLGMALKDDQLRTRAAKASGKLVLRSPKGNPTASLLFSPTAITVENGDTGDADIIVTANFDQPGARPMIDGALTHPIFGFLVLPLLDVSLPAWQDSAAVFWQLTEGQAAMPCRLTITCTTDNQSIAFSRTDVSQGEADTAFDADQAEILADRASLERLLLGHCILISEAIAGRIKFRGTVRQMAGISQCGQKLLLGELGTQ